MLNVVMLGVVAPNNIKQITFFSVDEIDNLSFLYWTFSKYFQVKNVTIF
jgi:hypothetical protein